MQRTLLLLLFCLFTMTPSYGQVADVWRARALYERGEWRASGALFDSIAQVEGGYGVEACQAWLRARDTALAQRALSRTAANCKSDYWLAHTELMVAQRRCPEAATSLQNYLACTEKQREGNIRSDTNLDPCSDAFDSLWRRDWYTPQVRARLEGEWHLARAEYQEALDALAEAGNGAQAHLLRAEAYLGLGEPGMGQRFAKRAKRKLANTWEWQSLWGRLLMADGSAHRGLRHLHTALERSSGSPRARRDYARGLYGANQPSEALAQVRLLLALYPADTSMLALGARAALAAGEAGVALRYLARVHIGDGHPLQRERGKALFLVGEPRQAKEDLIRFVRLHPQDTVALALLGRVHERLGERGQACSVYGRALEMGALWLYEPRRRVCP